MFYKVDVSEIRKLVMSQLTHEFERIRNPAAIHAIASYVSGELSSKLKPINDIPENTTWRCLLEKFFVDAYYKYATLPSMMDSNINSIGVPPMYDMAYEMEQEMWSYRYAPIINFGLSKFDFGYEIDISISG